MPLVTRNFGENVWNSLSEEINGTRRLKSEVVQCILTKLGDGTEHTTQELFDKFNVPSTSMDELEEGEIVMKKTALVGNFGSSPFITSESGEIADRIVAAINQCYAITQTAAARRRKSKKTKKSRKQTKRR